jgi:hypothetical protein
MMVDDKGNIVAEIAYGEENDEEEDPFGNQDDNQEEDDENNIKEIPIMIKASDMK